MKKLYETLKTLQKTRPHFQPNLLVMKCPEFIVNAVLGKPCDVPEETETCYGNTQAATAKPSARKAYRYHPKYQEV